MQQLSMRQKEYHSQQYQLHSLPRFNQSYLEEFNPKLQSFKHAFWHNILEKKIIIILVCVQRKFGRMASSWWKLGGPVAPLHELNPVRVHFIRQALCEGTASTAEQQAFPLKGISTLDVGCGGGVLAEVNLSIIPITEYEFGIFCVWIC